MGIADGYRSSQYRYYRCEDIAGRKGDIALEGKTIAQADSPFEWAIGKPVAVLKKWRLFKQMRPL